MAGSVASWRASPTHKKEKPVEMPHVLNEPSAYYLCVVAACVWRRGGVTVSPEATLTDSRGDVTTGMTTHLLTSSASYRELT